MKTGGALGIAGLAGCISSPSDGGSGDGNDDGTDNTSTDGTDGGSGDGEDTTNVGMVYATGGLGDNSFNDMANMGIKQAKKEFGVQFQNAEPDSPTDVESLQRQFAQSSSPDYDLICCIGYVQTNSLIKNAGQYPDQNFMLVDSVAETDNGDLVKNVANYVFKEQQGSFLVGHLAGQLTQMDFSAGKSSTKSGKKTVGFVGGKEVPLIKKFEAGYKAGVAHASEDIEVKTAYAGTYSDPVKGKEAALSMYENGADIVYHAAGGTGTGVFKAANQKGRFAIGVDSDQSKAKGTAKFSNVILASMVKKVDEAVYRSTKNVIDGEFKGGKVNTLGLEQGGIEAVYGADLGSEIPDDVKSKVKESREAIISGDIEVPTTVEK
ncbi:BMP family ABC transporter substrate-binding protein [Haladaptatus sp. W1]|uniref:BMP family lipoprotein n=1 Tax=Haladaptatus sp. W1 TaxID=1897478 RepID=UPI000849806A|nr:BMP family protein [Haladaptatus sp. W1]ODR82297.1 BMP family ABC transporter substrate-binding protein [Haladaptatus sp. W1]